MTLDIGTEDDFVEHSGINVTPLVDVALVLVLIFMVALPSTIIHGINVSNQLLKQYGLSTPQENVRVRLTQRGIFVKDEKSQNRLVPYNLFGTLLSQMIQISPTKRL